MVTRDTYKLTRSLLSALRDQGLLSDEQFREAGAALYAASCGGDNAEKYRLISKDEACRMLANISTDTLERMIQGGELRTAAITRNRVGIYYADIIQRIEDTTLHNIKTV